MTQMIPLDKGMFALVDDDRYTLVSARKWHASRPRKSDIWYARTNIILRDGRKTLIDMHRFILQPGSGTVVDHINGNGLDNRDANLRVCTHRENMRNARPRALHKKTSRFKGVCSFAQSRGLVWIAQIASSGRRSRTGTDRRFLGIFLQEEDAARAYDRAAIESFGAFAVTNFPRSNYE